MHNSSEHWLLGVDGGGTSCRVRLCNSAGQTLGEGICGSANAQLGVDTSYKAILNATNKALQEANLAPAILSQTYAGFGLAGAIDSHIVNQITEFPHPFKAVRVETDAVTACLGAHCGEDGAILILGTGSCGIAKQADNFHVIGGWGFMVSDHASGAQLGLSAIRASLEALEGLAAPSKLASVIMEKFDQSPSLLTTWASHAKPKDYAALVPLIIEHFDQGDPLAKALISTCLNQVSLLLNRLIQLGSSQICLMGGFSNFIAPLIISQYQEYLCQARGDAMDGALLLAKQLSMGVKIG